VLLLGEIALEPVAGRILVGGPEDCEGGVAGGVVEQRHRNCPRRERATSGGRLRQGLQRKRSAAHECVMVGGSKGQPLNLDNQQWEPPGSTLGRAILPGLLNFPMSYHRNDG
jgi:hypothetical protein